jgi:hypothetical protein
MNLECFELGLSHQSVNANVFLREEPEEEEEEEDEEPDDDEDDDGDAGYSE